MPAGLGYQFAPGADANGMTQQGQPQRRGLSPQAAVKLLQLRVPERPAASALAPQALLQSPGMAGAGGALQAIIQALAGRETPPMQPEPAPSAPQAQAGPASQPPMAPPTAQPSQMGAVAAPSYVPPAATPPPAAFATSAPPPPHFTPGIDEKNKPFEPLPMPEPEVIAEAMNHPVSGGQTLGSGGGGILGGRNWRSWLTDPSGMNESLF